MLGRWAFMDAWCVCRDCRPCRRQRDFVKRSYKRKEKRAWMREAVEWRKGNTLAS